MGNWKREEFTVVWDEDAPDAEPEIPEGIPGIDLGSTYPAASDTTAFDPADHTVDEVKKFVGENPDEVQNVYDAELAGKARSSLLDWLTTS